MTLIDRYAFNSCSNLNNLLISESMTEIGNYYEFAVSDPPNSFTPKFSDLQNIYNYKYQ